MVEFLVNSSGFRVFVFPVFSSHGDLTSCYRQSCSIVLRSSLINSPSGFQCLLCTI